MAIFQFPQQPIARPHVGVSIDSSGIGGGGTSELKPLALIGSASGGDPNQVYAFTSYLQAKSILRSGDLLDALELAWTPATNQSGAGVVYVVRVDSATVATATEGALTFTSQIFGSDANSIEINLGDNSVTSSKRLTVVLPQDNYQMTYDNLGIIFTIHYTGTTYAYVALEVTHNVTTGLATTLTIKAGADSATATAIKTYSLGAGAFQLTSALINDINSIQDFTASFVPYGNKDVNTAYLDTVTDQDIKTAPYTVKALGGDILNQLQWDTEVTVTYDPTKTISNFDTLLSGGTDGTVPTSWAPNLASFATIPAYYIVPLTADAAVHAEVTQFVVDQALNGHNMRAIVGGGVAETIPQLLARQADIRNQKVTLVGSSGTFTFADGRQVDLPSYMIAGQIGGLRSGLGVAEPITYKYLNLTGLDVYFTSAQLDQLNQAGILTIEYVRNRSMTGFRIVSDVTTYNDQTEPVMNNAATGELTDFLMDDLRYMLENTYVGTKLHLDSASLLKNSVQSFLDQKKLDPDSLIVDYIPDDVQVVINDNKANISFVVEPAVGLDFIQVTGVYQPYTANTSTTGVTGGTTTA